MLMSRCWLPGSVVLVALVCAAAAPAAEPVLKLKQGDHVAVIGLDDGTFPSRRSIEESPDPARSLEEERRLAYVAWTRAKQSLTLVYDPSAPSRFLLEAFDADELAPAGSRAA